MIEIKPVRGEDVPHLAQMYEDLWPDVTADEHGRYLDTVLRGQASALPLAVFVAVTPESQLVGFVETGLRSHADGCDALRSVGFVEGWFVAEAFRGRGIGGRLIAAAETWARGEGCVEMASDALIDNEASQRAHEALGFEVVDRCVHFRKPL